MLNVKPLIWKWLFLLTRIKLIFTRKVLRVALVRKRGFGTPEIPCSFYYVNTAELVIFTRVDHMSFGKKKKKKHRKWIVSKSTTVDFYSFVVRFCWSFFKNRAREKGKHKWRHHDVISLVCTLIEHSSPPISAREIAQLSWKRKSKFLWWGLLAEMKSMNVGNFFWLSFVCCVLHLRRWSTLKFTRVYNNISPFFVRHFFVVPWPRSLTNNRLPVCFWDRYIRVNLFLMLFHHARVLLT